MLPAPRSCMPGSTACVTASTPRRFTAITRSHMVLGRRTKKSSSAMPALFTSTSIGPSSASTAATAARADSVERTSSSTPMPSRSAASSRARSRSRSATATRAPSAASRSQVAGADAAGAAGDERDPSLEPHGGAGYLASLAPVETDPDHRRHRRAGLRPGAAPRRGGRPVVIGSRDAGRARGGRRRKVPRRAGRGLENGEAAKLGPIVFLAVPFRAQSENLTNLKDALEPGPDPGGRHRAAGGRRVGQGHAAARACRRAQRPSRPRRWCPTA